MAASFAVTASFTPAVCFGIVTLNCPLVSALPDAISFVPLLIVITAFASVFPERNVDKDVTAFTTGGAGGVVSCTLQFYTDCILLYFAVPPSLLFLLLSRNFHAELAVSINFPTCNNFSAYFNINGRIFSPVPVTAVLFQ